MNNNRLTVAGAYLACLTITTVVNAQPGPGNPANHPPGGPVNAIQQSRFTFGGRTATDRLTNDLVNQSNQLCRILSESYQQNRGFRETYREAYSLIEESKNIRAAVNAGDARGPRRENDRIAASLAQMDKKFHQIEAELRTWRPDPGPRSPRDSAQLVSSLNQFESSLHDMMEDYGVRSQRNVQPSPQFGNQITPPRR